MGTSRLRMVKWLAQGFTAKEWLSLKDDPRNPASQDSIHRVGGWCCLSGCRALWAVPPWPSLVPYLLPWRLLHLLQLLCLARPCSMCSGLWLLPAWFPGSCGRASFAWSSGSSWPALHLRIFSPSLCCLWTVWAYQGQPGSFGFIFLLWVTLAFSLRGSKSTHRCRPLFCTRLVSCITSDCTALAHTQPYGQLTGRQVVSDAISAPRHRSILSYSAPCN